MKNNKTKVITLAALIIAVIALSIGFAAFASTLNIQTGATVTPNDTFSVKFASSVTGANGEFTDFNDSLLDYLKTQGKYPIIGNSNNCTNMISLYDDDINADDTKNNNKGFRINLHNEVILPDKIIINTVLDKSLVCGNTINISLPSPISNSNSDKSLRFCGKYLIESSYHTWNGQSARTTLICSKQNLKLTNDYRNYHLLFN